MRVLLAACVAAKGDVVGNLARHVALLETAAAQGCDVAVLPEFSLTGSVDPARHPEQALPVDAPPVRDLVAASGRTGVAALFGIAERGGDGFYITQLYAHGGRLAGTYRKRHLGEDERAYHTGAAAGVFRLGGVPFGITICAEGGVDLPWASAAAGGARVVFYCSAPGLYGRRADAQSWRSGHAWWQGAGLGDAVRHARRYGFWVAMTTQAGSTQDEDFPGLAALIAPHGEVTHRLPDWRPGTLTVDIPLDAPADPAPEGRRPVRRAP
jgi:predicted amidohydrolase